VNIEIEATDVDGIVRFVAERDIGLLLPCNVVVREAEGRVLVHALDPKVMVSIPGRPELQDIADDADARVTRALEALARG